MSYCKTYDSFCSSALSLLKIIELEKQYLRDTELSKLDSLLKQKSELFAKNSREAEEIIDKWQLLDNSQQQIVTDHLKAITENVQANIDQLEISNRGNKKLMERCFNEIKLNPSTYLATAKLFRALTSTSVGIRQMV